MEIRTGKGMFVVAIFLTAIFVGWQLADDGLQFAKGWLSTRMEGAGSSANVVAVRARYQDTQRTYLLVVKPAGDPVRFVRVVVFYSPDGKPYDARIL